MINRIKYKVLLEQSEEEFEKELTILREHHWYPNMETFRVINKGDFNEFVIVLFNDDLFGGAK